MPRHRDWTEQEYNESMTLLWTAREAVGNAITSRNFHTKKAANLAIRVHQSIFDLGLVIEQFPEARQAGWPIFGSEQFRPTGAPRP